MRITHVAWRGKAVAVQAFDPGPDELAAIGLRSDVAEAFWAGRGVTVNRQLADRAGLRPGEPVALATPQGSRSFPILGVFTDFRIGYLGSVAMSRDLYKTLLALREAAYGDRHLVLRDGRIVDTVAGATTTAADESSTRH